MEEQKRPFHICPQVVDYATEFFRVPEELRTKGIVVVSGKKAGQFPGHT
jgi:hypothetical protein